MLASAPDKLCCIDFQKVTPLLVEGRLYTHLPSTPPAVHRLIGRLEHCTATALWLSPKAPVQALHDRCEEIFVQVGQVIGAGISYPLLDEFWAWACTLQAAVEHGAPRETLRNILRGFSCFFLIRENNFRFGEPKERLLQRLARGSDQTSACVLMRNPARLGGLLGRTIDLALRVPSERTLFYVPRGAVTLEALAQRLRRLIEDCDTRYAQDAQVTIQYLNGGGNQKINLLCQDGRARVFYERTQSAR